MKTVKFQFEISAQRIFKDLNANHWLGDFFIPYIFYPGGCFRNNPDFGIDRLKLINLIVDSDELISAMHNNWRYLLHPLYGLDEHKISTIAEKVARQYPGYKGIVEKLKAHSKDYRTELNGGKLKKSIDELQKLGYKITK